MSFNIRWELSKCLDISCGLLHAGFAIVISGGSVNYGCCGSCETVGLSGELGIGWQDKSPKFPSPTLVYNMIVLETNEYN